MQSAVCSPGMMAVNEGSRPSACILSINLRPAANVAAVEVESIGLIGGDEDARLAWNRIKREALAEEGVAVVQIDVGKALPDPTRFLQRVGDGGYLKRTVIERCGFG
jgi:hypothetical protein